MSGTTIDSGLQADSGLLQSLGHPKVTNYLDIQKGALDTAHSIWANREAQAQDAWGQALQASTDPSGVVDYQKANALAAANPAAAMGMMRGLKGSSELTGATQEQGIQRHKIISDGLTSLLDLPDDKLHDGVLTLGQQFIERGVMTPAQTQKALLSMSNDPALLRKEIERNRIALLPPQQQQDWLYGKPGTQDTGGEVQHGKYNQRTGAWEPATSTERTTSPESRALERDVYIPDKTNPDGSPAPGTTWSKVPQARGARPGAGGPAGTGGQPSTFPNGGRNPPPALLNPANQQPPAPAGGGATAPAPAAAPAQQPPAPVVRSEPPQGQPEKQKADVEAYQAASTAMPDQRKSVNAGETALEALKLAKTGPGSGWIQRYDAFATANGWPKINDADPAAYQIAQKNLIRFAQSQSKASGTDLGLETQLKANANVTDMLNSAATHVVIQDLGLARQRIAQTLEAPDTSGTGYGEHVKTFTGATDPRGFAWDLYEPAERAKILKEVRATKGGEAKLDRAIELADKHGLMRVPNARQSAAPPPAAPQPNALVPP